MKKVGIIGAGAWGIALGISLEKMVVPYAYGTTISKS